jgi:uncharacterized protein with GYD domain
MPKYLVEGSYTDEGLKGLIKDKASGRAAAVQKAAQSLGGKLDAIYYTFGDKDVILLVDMPDNASIAAFAITAGSTGLVRVQTTPLLTVEDVDNAVGKSVQYRAPGR